MIEKLFVGSIKQTKKTKKNVEKSFNVFGGAHVRPLNTLKLVWQTF